jgi:hypothetical protein
MNFSYPKAGYTFHQSLSPVAWLSAKRFTAELTRSMRLNANSSISMMGCGRSDPEYL